MEFWNGTSDSGFSEDFDWISGFRMMHGDVRDEEELLYSQYEARDYNNDDDLLDDDDPDGLDDEIDDLYDDDEEDDLLPDENDFEDDKLLRRLAVS